MQIEEKNRGGGGVKMMVEAGECEKNMEKL